LAAAAADGGGGGDGDAAVDADLVRLHASTFWLVPLLLPPLPRVLPLPRVEEGVLRRAILSPPLPPPPPPFALAMSTPRQAGVGDSAGAAGVAVANRQGERTACLTPPTCPAPLPATVDPAGLSVGRAFGSAGTPPIVMVDWILPRQNGQIVPLVLQRQSHRE
jgi:hypothetical protein